MSRRQQEPNPQISGTTSSSETVHSSFSISISAQTENELALSDGSGELRLQKYLAQAGVCSRREAEKLIVDGKVKVNGVVVRVLGTKVVPGRDVVKVGRRTLTVETKKFFVFHKPAGVVTTMSDPEQRRCVGDYLRQSDIRLFPVGRLDIDVSGLLLLTNDGDYAEKLLHPRGEIERVYWARVHGAVFARDLEVLCRGVQLEDGMGRAKRGVLLKQSRETLAHLGRVSGEQSLVEIVVTEGRKHFVKNIFEAIGHPVLKLCRVAFGPYVLSTLKKGEMRAVDRHEL